jgi:hypothetical protein
MVKNWCAIEWVPVPVPTCADQSVRRSYSRKIKNTADSTHVGYFGVCSSESAYASLDYIRKKLVDVHCVLYCLVSMGCEATYVSLCCETVLLCL